MVVSRTQDAILQSIDIGYWYMHNPTCPHCGVNLREMHPAANLYPHFTGYCAKQAVRP